MGFQAQQMVSAPQFRDPTSGLMKALENNQNRLLTNSKLEQDNLREKAADGFRQTQLGNEATAIQLASANRLEDLKLRAADAERSDKFYADRLAMMNKADQLTANKYAYEQRRNEASDIASSLVPSVGKVSGYAVAPDQRSELISAELDNSPLNAENIALANSLGERLSAAQQRLKEAEFNQNLLNMPGDQYGVTQRKAEALTVQKEADAINNKLIREYNPKFSAAESKIDKLITANKPTTKALKDYGLEVRAELFAEAQKRKGSALDKYDKAAVDAQVAKYINEYKTELSGPDALKAKLREYKSKNDIDTNSDILLKQTKSADGGAGRPVSSAEYQKAVEAKADADGLWNTASDKALMKSYDLVIDLYKKQNSL